MQHIIIYNIKKKKIFVLRLTKDDIYCKKRHSIIIAKKA